MMNLNPPPTQKELEDMYGAFANHIDRVEFLNNQGWYNNWAHYLIGLRRAYQNRFLAEAYNEHSVGP